MVHIIKPSDKIVPILHTMKAQSFVRLRFSIVQKELYDTFIILYNSGR